MTEPFGEPGKNEEHFKFSLFLVLCNRLTSCAVAIGGLAVRSWVVCEAASCARVCASVCTCVPLMKLHPNWFRYYQADNQNSCTRSVHLCLYAKVTACAYAIVCTLN